MPGGWHILNPAAIAAALGDASEQAKAAVADAFEILLENPYDPPGLTVHPMRGGSSRVSVDPRDPVTRRRSPRRDEETLYIAYFPDNWYVTFTIHPDGLPPISEKLIRIRAMVRQVL